MRFEPSRPRDPSIDGARHDGLSNILWFGRFEIVWGDYFISPPPVVTGSGYRLGCLRRYLFPTRGEMVDLLTPMSIDNDIGGVAMV